LPLTRLFFAGDGDAVSLSRFLLRFVDVAVAAVGADVPFDTFALPIFKFAELLDDKIVKADWGDVESNGKGIRIGVESGKVTKIGNDSSEKVLCATGKQ
jgi:hypothetical protein